MTVADAALAVHITAGAAGLLLGPVAMLAPKRRGRHTRAGLPYQGAMAVVCLSALGLALADFARVGWFVPIALFSWANALVGWHAVRTRRPGWLPRHIGGMGGSYIALVTALLVVNAGTGAAWAWVLPTVAGSLLIAQAIRRRAQPRPSARPAPG